MREVTVTELLVFAGALEARLDQMLGGADEVSLPEEGVSCNVTDVRTFFAGGPPVPPRGANNSKTSRMRPGPCWLSSRSSASSPPDSMFPFARSSYAATGLYGKSLVAERDRRVAENFGTLSKRRGRHAEVT